MAAISSGSPHFPSSLIAGSGFVLSTLVKKYPVSGIHFPFWLLIAESFAHPVAFSSVAKMDAFLDRNAEMKWAIRLVTRYEVAPVLKELAELGHHFVCFDPAANGTGGASVSIEEFSIERP